MDVAEAALTDDWMGLLRGEDELGGVRFRPGGDPAAVEFRVPQARFQVDDLTQLLTLEDLLHAAGIPNEAVESWRVLDETHAGEGGANPELKRLLPPPAADAAHLAVAVRLKSQPAADLAPEQWQVLEAKWKAILGVEATIDASRMSVEGLRAELESEFRRTLAVEHKVHALQSDVANWNKAKSRVHYVLPKAREFVHRATWAQGVPERKRLEELFRAHIEPRVPFPDVDRERERLDHLHKDRQNLASQGAAVSQECRAILGEIRGALGTLQRNATENANRKRSAAKQKGKHF